MVAPSVRRRTSIMTRGRTACAVTPPAKPGSTAFGWGLVVALSGLVGVVVVARQVRQVVEGVDNSRGHVVLGCSWAASDAPVSAAAAGGREAARRSGGVGQGSHTCERTDEVVLPGPAR